MTTPSGPGGHYHVRLSPIPPLSVRQALADLLGERLETVFPGGTGRVTMHRRAAGYWSPGRVQDGDQAACLLHLSGDMPLDGPAGHVQQALDRLAANGYTIEARSGQAAAGSVIRPEDRYDGNEGGRSEALQALLAAEPDGDSTITWTPSLG